MILKFDTLLAQDKIFVRMNYGIKEDGIFKDKVSIILCSAVISKAGTYDSFRVEHVQPGMNAVLLENDSSKYLYTKIKENLKRIVSEFVYDMRVQEANKSYPNLTLENLNTKLANLSQSYGSHRYLIDSIYNVKVKAFESWEDFDFINFARNNGVRPIV